MTMRLSDIPFVSRLRTVGVGLVAALALAGAAISQPGSSVLTTLVGTYQVPIITTGPLNTVTSLTTLQTFILSGGTVGPGTFTTVTANDIAAGDASLGVAGLAAAQGGAIALVGGTSSTSANAGGAITSVGGTPGATGVGGAVSMTGGVGGTTSGTGGAATLKGGAGTKDAIGGAALVTGGAGNGTGNGGAVTITAGAAGATGSAGAVGITAGAATAAAGGTVTITATAGAGTTNAGGSVNLVPGAAASTGIPGKVQVNGDANLMCGTYYFTGTPAATNQVFYIASRAMIVTSINQIHSVAAGGTSTLDITKDVTTGAPASGTALTTAAFDLNATANTIQTGTLSATIATLTMAAGNRLAVKFNHAIQSSAGVVVTACMAPL